MTRFFNTAGPMIPEDHYCIDPLTRIDWEEIQRLIRDKRYFVMHAPRQTGKTSALYAMMHALNAESYYACAYANIETVQASRGDVTRGIPAACSMISTALSEHLQRPDLKQWFLTDNRAFPPEDQLFQLLKHWTVTSDKPTVLFLDEIDALVGDTLISVLRQIRTGYNDRPAHFPQSVILCGVRDVRDYRIYQEVIPRELTWSTQVMIYEQETEWYVTPEHRLDMAKLLGAFQQFFREHADAWVEGFDYREAGQQLLLQAFLQRIVNGGGHINREYGLGRKRTDLLIEWPMDGEQGMHGPLQRVVIELKLLRGALDTVIAKGLEQTADYARRVGADEAHLMIFDRGPGRAWDDKIWVRGETFDGLPVTVWGA